MPIALRAQESGSGAVAEAVRLRNSGSYSEAIALLKSHLRAYPDDGEAIRLLAQTQYWSKDFAAARETYERAVKLHPEDTTLRAQYSQFLAETATQRGWVKLVPSLRHDDQPINRLELQGEAGWYIRPDASFAVRVTGMRFSLADTASRNAAAATLAFAGSSAESGMRVELAGGILNRSFGTSNEFIGSGALSFRVTPALRLRVVAERAGYFHTESSLSTDVTTNSGGGALSLSSSRGWLAELVAQLQQFHDDNSMTTAFAWVLAPLISSARRTIHIGYSAAIQDARELRFALEDPIQSSNPASASYNFAGRYDPYYTPKDLQTHSVIAAVALGAPGKSVLRINGTYAVLGSENAPRFVPVALTAPPRTVVRMVLDERDIHPWNVRTSIDISSSAKSSLLLGAEIARTGFYSSSSAFAAWTVKF